MIALEQAYKIVDVVAGQIELTTEKITVDETLNRVLAVPQKSKLELPPFNKAAMDGFAIAKDDRSKSYQITEIIAAGQMPTIELSPGYAAQVMTGAPVPKNTWQVIPVEYTQQENNKVYILKYPEVQHICRQGEDVKPGMVIANQGQIITPLIIANLIACGITNVEVYARPDIAILSTGDEIVDAYVDLVPGKIMDSNRPMLAALCQKYNYRINYYSRVSDNLVATKSALENALKQANIIILSGGVSMGEFDFVGKAVVELGFTTHFNRVAIKPGKPTLFASKDNKLIFGLPGNPNAVYLTFKLLVQRAIARMQKLTVATLYELRLAKTYTHKKAERAAFIPGKLTAAGEIEPINYHGSAHLLALLNADVFFVVDRNIDCIKQKEKVKVITI
jgi:molybdopterin molybdotransferase